MPIVSIEELLRKPEKEVNKLPEAPLTEKQALEIYWQIQSRLGVLVEQAPASSKGLLKEASMQILRAKRVWLGGIGEVVR